MDAIKNIFDFLKKALNFINMIKTFINPIKELFPQIKEEINKNDVDAITKAQRTLEIILENEKKFTETKTDV